ncbi:MAG: hypothetical protein IPL99_12425 [Candidatus Competibacteraceae bacterium]|nr:hypothetical protein [Candidatus Competibacteraceae bacterium]
MTVTALRAREESAPVGVEPLDGRLLSNRPADTLTPAAEWIQWYASRWSIEVFFRILKTGCRVEALPLSTLDRLEPALALYDHRLADSVLDPARANPPPELPCDAVLDPAKGRPSTSPSTTSPRRSSRPAAGMLGGIARLGGHLGRKCDGPPGPKALWIGLQRARDLAWGMQLPSDLHAPSTG